MKYIAVKVLSSKRSQRYAMTRSLIQAQSGFEREHPEFRLDVREITTAQDILHYTPVFAYPSLMIGDKLVCVGRFPSRDEILGWLESEIQRKPVETDPAS